MKTTTKTKLLCFALTALFSAACAQPQDPSSEMEGLKGPFVKDERPAPPANPPGSNEDQDQEETDTTQGELEQAIGFYASGKLINAFEFPFDGEGFLKIQRPRKRHYGTYDLIEVVRVAAKMIKDGFPNGERLQIGDTCASKGGQLASHKSHQNGLDADIVYYRNDHREMNPELNATFDESFVKNGKVTANFDMQRNWAFFSALVKSGRIKRMFVDLAIKKAACSYAAALGLNDESVEVLRRLRIEPLHDDHVHIRVTCPKNSPNCQQQLEPAEGSGCESLRAENITSA